MYLVLPPKSKPSWASQNRVSFDFYYAKSYLNAPDHISGTYKDFYYDRMDYYGYIGGQLSSFDPDKFVATFEATHSQEEIDAFHIGHAVYLVERWKKEFELDSELDDEQKKELDAILPQDKPWLRDFIVKTDKYDEIWTLVCIAEEINEPKAGENL